MKCFFGTFFGALLAMGVVFAAFHFLCPHAKHCHEKACCAEVAGCKTDLGCCDKADLEKLKKKFNVSQPRDGEKKCKCISGCPCGTKCVCTPDKKCSDYCPAPCKPK